MASNWTVLNFREEGIEEIYPIIYATEAEATALRDRLLAGADPSFYQPERGDFLDITFIEDEEFEPAFDRRNADRIDGYDRDDLGESPDF